MEWKGGKWTKAQLLAVALELHPWRFDWLPCGDVFEPKLNAQQGAICEAFFQNALSRAHCGVLVPTSLWLGPIDSLPFATVVFWLHLFFKGKAWKENSFVNFSLQPTATHTRHALKLICQTTFDSTLFKSLLSHAGQLSCRDVMEVTWPKPRIFSCSKRRVCFHSNQYFYIPQKKISIYQTNSVYVKLYLYSTK